MVAYDMHLLCAEVTWASLCKDKAADTVTRPTLLHYYEDSAKLYNK